MAKAKLGLEGATRDAELEALRYVARTLANQLEVVVQLLPAEEIKASTLRLVASARRVIEAP